MLVLKQKATQHFMEPILPEQGVRRKTAQWKQVETAKKALEPTDFIVVIRDGYSRDITVPIGEHAKDFSALLFLNNVFVVDPTAPIKDKLILAIKDSLRGLRHFKSDIWAGTVAEFDEKALEEESVNFFKNFVICVMGYKRMVNQMPRNALAGLASHSRVKDKPAPSSAPTPQAAPTSAAIGAPTSTTTTSTPTSSTTTTTSSGTGTTTTTTK